MGCASSHEGEAFRVRFPATIKELRLPAGALSNAFNMMDRDRSGTIDLVEFLDACRLDRSPFVLRAFAICSPERAQRPSLEHITSLALTFGVGPSASRFPAHKVPLLDSPAHASPHRTFVSCCGTFARSTLPGWPTCCLTSTATGPRTAPAAT